MLAYLQGFATLESVDDAWSSWLRTWFLLTSCATASFVVEAPTQFRCLSNNLHGFWPLSAASLCTHIFFTAPHLQSRAFVPYELCAMRLVVSWEGSTTVCLTITTRTVFFVVWTMSGQAAKKNNGEQHLDCNQKIPDVRSVCYGTPPIGSNVKEHYSYDCEFRRKM